MRPPDRPHDRKQDRQGPVPARQSVSGTWATIARPPVGVRASRLRAGNICARRADLDPDARGARSRTEMRSTSQMAIQSSSHSIAPTLTVTFPLGANRGHRRVGPEHVPVPEYGQRHQRAHTPGRRRQPGSAAASRQHMLTPLPMSAYADVRKLGWSWQEIAGRLGVTRETVHRKHGKRTGRR